MRDAAGEPAHGLHLLRVEELRLHGECRADVPVNADVARHGPLLVAHR
jgi:hypothetical protein